MSNIDALVVAPGTRTTDWPGLRTWSSISRRLTQLFWVMPAGVTQGWASSARAFGATTGADSVSGVNQTSVPAKADWVAARPALSRSCWRMERKFIGMMVDRGSVVSRVGEENPGDAGDAPFPGSARSWNCVAILSRDDCARWLGAGTLEFVAGPPSAGKGRLAGRGTEA